MCADMRVDMCLAPLKSSGHRITASVGSTSVSSDRPVGDADVIRSMTGGRASAAGHWLVVGGVSALGAALHSWFCYLVPALGL